MIRLVMLLLAVLALNVVPLAAAAHGAPMAQMHQPGHDMAQMTHSAPCDTADCRMETALCAWVCAGGGIAAPFARVQDSSRTAHRTPWPILAQPLPQGLPPPREERPPRAASL